MASTAQPPTCDKCGAEINRPRRLPPLVCPTCDAHCCDGCMPFGVRTRCVDCDGDGADA